MTFTARFDQTKAHAIRRLHVDYKLTYKHINKLCPMDKKTFFRVVGQQGAYAQAPVARTETSFLQGASDD